MTSISIANLDKATVLAALYNRARPQGMGFLHYDPAPMTREDAQTIIDSQKYLYFDYLKGRVMKVDLSQDTFDPSGYDRDNGYGAAQEVIDALKDTGEILTEEGKAAQQEKIREALKDLDAAPKMTTVEQREGMTIFTLGVGDLADTVANTHKDLFGDQGE